MPKVGRAYVDKAGGVIMRGIQSVQVDTLPVAYLGAPIADHGQNEHNSATLLSNGNPGVVAENIPVCKTGDTATCGHQLISNSSVEVG